jgi:hypothetical protein
LIQGGGHRGRTALAAVALVLAVPAIAAAQGGYDTDPTREQWVAQADRECKDAGPRFHALVRKVSKAGKQGKAVKYGHALVRLARFLLGVRQELAELRRPPADSELIQKWIDTSIKADRAAVRSGKAYVHGNIGRARSAFKKAGKLSKKAFKIGRPFHFEHC